MAERTGIAWTRSTFNPWIGCTEVSPGCDACYARELDKRHRYGGTTHWGAGVERFVTSLDYWLKPERWNALAEKERASGEIEDVSEYGDYYPHDATCGNCGSRQHAYILKGRSLKGLAIECVKCGCNIRLQPYGTNWSET